MNSPCSTFLISESQHRKSSVFLSESGRISSPREVLLIRSTSCLNEDANLRSSLAGDDSYASRSQIPLRQVVPPVVLSNRRSVNGANAAVIQVWEGKVLSVDPERGVMETTLEAKVGSVPPHAAEIDLQWVSDQDRDLVEPGAIFYLSLFKRTKHGSIENTQELRFRRLPAWTRKQVAEVHEDAARMLKKLKARPLAE